MKKSVLALAVTGALAPMSASAADVYGRVDLGLESPLEEGSRDNGNANVSSFIFNGFNANENSQSSPTNDLQLQNGNQSRIGVTGSEDIGGGWTASAKIELEANVLSDENAGFTDNNGLSHTRLGWVQFSNDTHSITIGKQWQPAYEYMGWNQGRFPTHGYASYFQTFAAMGDAGAIATFGGASTGATGYRQDSSIGYTFGGGGYSDDPFTFDVLLGINNGGETFQNNPGNPNTFGPSAGDTGGTTPGGNPSSGPQNQATISSIQFFAAGTFGPGITINGGVVKDFREYDDSQNVDNVSEPTLFALGGRFPVGDLVEIGASAYQVDTDNPADNANDDGITTVAVTGHWSFGGGWGAQTGLGWVDSGEDAQYAFGDSADNTSINLGVSNQITSRTSLRVIFEQMITAETAKKNETVENVEGSGVLQLGIQHDF